VNQLNELFEVTEHVDADATVEAGRFEDPNVAIIQKGLWKLDFI